MAIVTTFMAFMLLTWVTNSSSLSTSENQDSYVEDACSVTKYHDLCVRSLAPFSNTAKTSPSKWARAGVSVTIGQVKGVAQYLIKLKKHKRTSMRGRRNRIALSDCVECFQVAIDDLHKSLGILRKLSARSFDTQMEDLTTFVSAALTNEDTCLDGFDEEERDDGAQVVNLIKHRVLNTTYLTSNALALINKLATSGL